MAEGSEYGSGRRRPGIVDVAALAGVAPSTVSRSLSQQGKVSARTRERVMDAARTRAQNLKDPQADVAAAEHPRQ